MGYTKTIKSDSKLRQGKVVDHIVMKISSSKCSTKDRLFRQTFVFHFSISLKAQKNLKRANKTKNVLPKIITYQNTLAILYKERFRQSWN